jgi:predicted hydrocarbon binding protein
MTVTSELIGSPRELLAGGKIKGGMMSAHIGWATGGRAAADVSRFWNALPLNLQQSLGGMILTVNWYEFAHLIAVDRAILKVYGGGDTGVLREVGAYSARLNLNGVYRVYRRSSIHDFLENGARFHPKFQDFGEAAYVKTAPFSGQMIHSRYSSYSPLFCESALGFYRESLQLHGAHRVAVDETSCQCRGAKSCTFTLGWS